MVWNRNQPFCPESSKIAHLVVNYLQGRFLDLGCGAYPVWPSAIGVDSGAVFSDTKGINGDVADLSMFADGSMDGIFASHVLEDFPMSKVPDVLKEWARVLRVGGHLVVYLPSANLYPKMGEPGANPMHQSDWYPGDLERILQCTIPIGTLAVTHGWRLVESEERNQGNEYGLFVVVQKIADPIWVEDVWQRNPDGKKRALVIRYGAIGDAIQTSSIFPLLKEQGYHVTLNCKGSTKKVLKHDPHIDEWLIQEKDFVPNEQLGPYWEALGERYDTVVNLCESVEGGVLQIMGRMGYNYPQPVRHALYGHTGYLERMHDIAMVPHVFNPRFYPSDYENRWAKALKKAYTGGPDTPLVVIQLSGSALHKIYPHTAAVCKLLLQHSPCHIVLTGDKGMQGEDIQDAVVAIVGDNPRLHPMAGKWSIRQTLAFAIHADVVIGPETGVLNAVAFEPDVHAIMMLSHSSRENIGHNWPNATILEPPPNTCPCFPCHRLHPATWDFCNQSEDTAAALCATQIRPEVVFKAAMDAMVAKFASENAA